MGYVQAVVSAGALVATLAACGDSGTPLGSGSHLKADVDGSAPPPPDVSDATSGDSPFSPLDAQYGPLPDGYAPLSVCAQCACGAGTYCFGGSAYTPFSGACDQTKSTTQSVGCHVIPVGCAAEPDCVCILESLVLERPCYQACADDAKGGFVVYCPP